MPAIGVAGLGGVVDGSGAGNVTIPHEADLLLVVRRIAAIKLSRSLAREKSVERRHRAVVKIGGAGPNSRERKRHVAVRRFQDLVIGARRAVRGIASRWVGTSLAQHP